MPTLLTERLKQFSKKAARWIARKREEDSKLHVLKLYLLPIEARIGFEIDYYVFKYFYELALYLEELIEFYKPSKITQHQPPTC